MEGKNKDRLSFEEYEQLSKKGKNIEADKSIKRFKKKISEILEIKKD